eukprot:221124_1
MSASTFESTLQDKLKAVNLHHMLDVLNDATNIDINDLRTGNAKDIKNIISTYIVDKFMDTLDEVKNTTAKAANINLSKAQKEVSFDILPGHEHADEMQMSLSMENEERHIDDDSKKDVDNACDEAYHNEDMIGMTVDIYSNTKQQWVEGIIKHMEGDILCVFYGKKMKWLKKDSKRVRFKKGKIEQTV